MYSWSPRTIPQFFLFPDYFLGKMFYSQRDNYAVIEIRNLMLIKVDFNTNLKTPKERDDYKIELGDDVYSGESNGLTVYLDVEEYDHGYLPAKGIFFLF